MLGRCEICRNLKKKKAGVVQYGDKKIRPMPVLGSNLTFSNRQFPTLFA